MQIASGIFSAVFATGASQRLMVARDAHSEAVGRAHLESKEAYR